MPTLAEVQTWYAAIGLTITEDGPDHAPFTLRAANGTPADVFTDLHAAQLALNKHKREQASRRPPAAKKSER